MRRYYALCGWLVVIVFQRRSIGQINKHIAIRVTTVYLVTVRQKGQTEYIEYDCFPLYHLLVCFLDTKEISIVVPSLVIVRRLHQETFIVAISCLRLHIYYYQQHISNTDNLSFVILFFIHNIFFLFYFLDKQMAINTSFF